MSELIDRPAAEPVERRVEVHLANARRLMKKARADSTWRAYQSDWRQFEQFCDCVRLTALPASVKTLVSFLSSQASERKSPSTIQRRLVAIRLVHTCAGFERPDTDPAITELLKGIRRDWHQPKVQKTAAVAEDVMRMADSVDVQTNKGLRDRALLLFGFAGAFRRSEIVGIEIGHIAYQDEGVKVTIPHSKTDQDAQGQTIAVRAEPGSNYCPVHSGVKGLDHRGGDFERCRVLTHASS